MSVYKKLQLARYKLSKVKLEKSGKNSFAKFNYFELADFMPAVTEIFNEVGLCGVVSFTNDTAYLTIYDVESDDPKSFTTFTSPLVMASMDRIQPIQSLGGTHTYYRRYLYLLACDLTDSDLVDSMEPVVPKKVELIKKEEVKKVETKKEEIKETPLGEKLKEKLQGKEGPWQLKVNQEGDWDKAVLTATNILLTVVKTKEDVDSIYRNNRVIYDVLKEKHKATYDEILSVFKITKEELK